MICREGEVKKVQGFSGVFRRLLRHLSLQQQSEIAPGGPASRAQASTAGGGHVQTTGWVASARPAPLALWRAAISRFSGSQMFQKRCTCTLRLPAQLQPLGLPGPEQRQCLEQGHSQTRGLHVLDSDPPWTPKAAGAKPQIPRPLHVGLGTTWCPRTFAHTPHTSPSSVFL